MRKSFVFPALIATVALFSTTSNANLITNGSFELLPDGATLANGSWTTYQSIPGWTSSTFGIEVRNNVAGVAQDGNIFVEMDTYHNSAMYSQLVKSDVGKAYTLSYYYAPRAGIKNNSNGIQLYFNNKLLEDVTGDGSSSTAWSLKSYAVIGTGNDIITFAASGNDDSYGGSIDNVSMEASSVPEPSIFALLSFSLFGIAGLRRKFKK